MTRRLKHRPLGRRNASSTTTQLRETIDTLASAGFVEPQEQQRFHQLVKGDTEEKTVATKADR